MKAEVTVIKLGEDWFEIKKVDPPKQEVSDSSIPTLMEVFNKVKPEWVIGEANENRPEGFFYDNNIYHNQLSTETQCRRIQALIALQAIADYYNGEVDYRGSGYMAFLRIDEFVVSDRIDSNWFTCKFKQSEHAERAIEILRAEGLLDNLK